MSQTYGRPIAGDLGPEAPGSRHVSESEAATEYPRP
jgi:hypothetical protein